MVFDFLKRQGGTPPDGGAVPGTEVKASASGPVIAYASSGRVVWSARDTVSLTRSGFAGNPVGFRAVKMIAETAGVTASAIYNYFPAKKDIYVAIVEEGENYIADEAVIDIWSDGEKVGELFPQKRVYSGKDNPMTDASIDKTFFRDLYAAIGEELEDGAWSMRVYYKPLVRWIWLGSLLMTIGGVIAVSDRRYRQAVASKSRQSDSRASAAARA